MLTAPGVQKEYVDEQPPHKYVDSRLSWGYNNGELVLHPAVIVRTCFGRGRAVAADGYEYTRSSASSYCSACHSQVPESSS
ncbi:hypothetical protein AVEN_25407-1 [Araneus ventricosus]|uniref:Uncharacterized protein n=1 Tax=Araneus ventricosus TaxID=182803 RepID=A0A4Y2MN74_ARAVE|nr:hypothetical protein AVEN_25407-1 [Araneus ventricosus]